MNCPYLYKYIYIDGKYPPYNAQSSLGVSLHRTLAKYAREKGDFSDLLLYYDENWLNSGYSSPQQQMEFYDKGAKMLESFYLRQQNRKSQVIYLETDFEFEFEKWLIKGTIDRIDRLPDGKIEIIDYKIGFENDLKYDPVSSFQLGLYALGAKNGLNVFPSILSYWFLREDNMSSVVYDACSDNAVFGMVRKVGEKILSGDFSKKGNCLKCSINGHCKFSNIG